MEPKRPLETNYNQEEVFPISIDSSYKQKNVESPFSSATDDFDERILVERTMSIIDNIIKNTARLK